MRPILIILLAASFALCITLLCLRGTLGQLAAERMGYMNRSGEIAFKLAFSKPFYRRHFSNGFVVDDRYNGKVKFLDKSGENGFQKVFSDADDFSEGVAGVLVDSQWGFIGLDGKMVIAATFEDVTPFKEEVSAVKSNGKWGYIDRSGKWIIKPMYDLANPFADGLACVLVNKKVGFIDHSGKLAISPKFDYVWCFSNGIAKVGVKSKPAWCIDKTGKKIFDFSAICTDERTTHPEWPYDDLNSLSIASERVHMHESELPSLGCFKEGLLNFACDKKYGFLNSHGEIAIPAKFKRASSFYEGLAAVSTRNSESELYGYIDKTGKSVIPSNFTFAGNFHEGLAFVVEAGGKSGFIDHTGAIILPATPMSGGFHEGIADFGRAPVGL